MYFLSFQVCPHRFKQLTMLPNMRLFTFHDQLIKFMFIFKIVFPLQANYSFQYLSYDFLIQFFESDRVQLKYFIGVVGQVNYTHVQKVVPSLRIVYIFQFFVALFQKCQAVLMIDFRNEHLIDKLVMKFDHPQIISSPQYFNNNLILVDIGFKKANIFGTQVFFDQKINRFGDPLWERKSKLEQQNIYIFTGLNLLILGFIDKKFPIQEIYLVLNDNVNLVIHLLQYNAMKAWATLIGFCISNFSNGMGFGIYTDNLQTYADAFQTSKQVIQNTFYIGLVVEVILCFPAIRIIEWRFDYSIISAAYMTACSYWLQYFSLGNVVIVIAGLVLNSIAQLLLLPSPLYLAEVWFPLQKRSFVIGMGFYSNLLGFGIGGTLSSLLGHYPIVTVQHILLFTASFATLSFILSVLLIKNRPKVRIQVLKKVEWKRHVKDLWRQKFTSYNIIMVSVFLGVSWTFLSQFETLQLKFDTGVAALNLGWILSGAFFGILMSFLVQIWLSKTGNYKYYDNTCKIVLFVGILGNIVLGILYQFQVEDFGWYLISVIFIGIGTIGFFGVAYLSIIESMYPVPVLLIGTLISLFASIYSIISLAVTQLFPFVNAYFSIAAVTFLPWLYYCVTFETNFKRYKYYLNEKQSKFQLLKIEDINQKNPDE